MLFLGSHEKPVLFGLRPTDERVLVADDPAVDPDKRAFAFLHTYGALFGASESERQHLGKSSINSDGTQLRVAKVYEDSIGCTNELSTEDR